jgi:hypothetical protein
MEDKPTEYPIVWMWNAIIATKKDIRGIIVGRKVVERRDRDLE